MKFRDKLKETLLNRAAEGLAVSISIIIIWAASKIAPVIELPLSKEVLTSLLFASLALNLVLVLVFWIFNKKSEFKLKYGIYWDRDKNPHCPSCKIPIGAYSDYQSGKGYYCKPCGKIFSLTDALGNEIDPQTAISEL